MCRAHLSKENFQKIFATIVILVGPNVSDTKDRKGSFVHSLFSRLCLKCHRLSTKSTPFCPLTLDETRLRSSYSTADVLQCGITREEKQKRQQVVFNFFNFFNFLIFFFFFFLNFSFQAFKTLMGDFRRVGYLLGSLSVLPGLEQNFAVTKPSNPKWLLETTANLCDFVYFICDNVSLLADYGILPLKRATNDFIYDEIGTKVWVASSVCWLLLDVMEVQHLLRIAKRDASQEKDLINLYKSLASNACNLLIGWYFLFPDKPVTSPMAGGLGMIAALISLHSMWVKK